VRWSIYIVAVLLAAALDASFGSVLAIGELRGQFLPAVVVFALLAAPRKIGVRLAMLAGLVADLLAPVVLDSQEVLVVPGPRVLAYALGALAVIQLRSLLYRQNPLAGAAATFVLAARSGCLRVPFLDARALPRWRRAVVAGKRRRRGLAAIPRRRRRRRRGTAHALDPRQDPSALGVHDGDARIARAGAAGPLIPSLQCVAWTLRLHASSWCTNPAEPSAR
jgi:hypothetical protein